MTVCAVCLREFSSRYASQGVCEACLADAYDFPRWLLVTAWLGITVLFALLIMVL